MTYDPRWCACGHSIDDHDDYVGCIMLNCDCQRFTGITHGPGAGGSGG